MQRRRHGVHTSGSEKGFRQTELIKASGGISIDVQAITRRLGPSAFDPDGMRPTRAAYEELAPNMANAITTISR